MLAAIFDGLDEVLGLGVEVDGQFFGGAVELGEDAAQRLGKGGGRVLHARGLPDAAAAPGLAHAQARLTRARRSSSDVTPTSDDQQPRAITSGEIWPKAPGVCRIRPTVNAGVGPRAGRRGRPPRWPSTGTTSVGASAQADAGQRQQRHPGQHGAGDLVGVLGARASAGSPGR